MNPVIAGLAVILLWDGYFFINYIIGLFKNYIIKEWNPGVSIIIPAYNEEKNIIRAISNALEQNYPDFEVIVVDDGSEDGTYNAASSIRDPRLRVIRIEHAGKSRALNAGLKLARGEIIATTDADSFLERNALRELVQRFYSPEVVCAGGQVRVTGKSFIERAQDIEHLRIAMFRRAKELDDLSLAPGPIAAFRKDALEMAGGFVEDTVEDYATTRAVKAFGKAVYAPRAKVWTRMPVTLRALWEQRKRWVLGDMRSMGGGFMKEWIFLWLSDVVAALDVVVPPILLLTGLWWAFAAWWGFETLTMLIPTHIEGGPITNALLFPIAVQFWSCFYLTVHMYGYLTLLADRM